MPMVMPEWKKFIKDWMNKAYEAGEIKTFEDFDKIARDACQAIPIQDKTLMGSAIFAAKVNNPIMTALRRKEAEVNLPMTNESLIEDLPISKKMCKTLKDNHLFTVGDIISFLEGDKYGLISLRHIGILSVKEIYEALRWADIEIPARAFEKNAKGEDADDVKWALRKVEELDVQYFQEDRVIVLDQGEVFKAELCPEGQTIIICNGRSLTIHARRITITAEG